MTVPPTKVSGKDRLMLAFLRAKSMYDPFGWYRSVLDGLVWKRRP